VAWEDEFLEMLDDYKIAQNVKAIIASLEQLFKKYKLEVGSRAKPKELLPNELEVIGHMFLGGKGAGSAELW